MSKPKINLQGVVASASPLYLHTGDVLRVDLDNSQRLCIHRAEGPIRHVPLHLVSRIVCHSGQEIDSSVWIACLRRGINVAVVERDGTPIGWCMGVRRTESSLRILLEHALDDPNWDIYFQEWYEKQKMALAAEVFLLCGLTSTPAARREPRIALCNGHAQKHHQPCGHWVDAIAHMVQLELSSVLVRETGAPELLAWYRPGFNLLNELGSLLALHAHTDVHHLMELPHADELSVWAVRLYEKHAAHWQQRMGYLMTAFENFLRQHWL